ncbi:MAG: hypothetical protein AAGA42_18980 [Actinomycetota bacterium]
MVSVLTHRWRTAFVGGGATLGAYLLVLIAARSDPLAPVAALRETSTILAVFVGARLLNESVERRMYGAAALAAAGAVTLAL